jgi:hypothetical protein
MSRRYPRGRFASDAISYPLWLRAALTLPVVVLGCMLTKLFVVVVINGDPGPGVAILPLVIGVFLVYAVPFLRGLWRSSTSWRHAQMRGDVAANKIEDRASRISATPNVDAFGWPLPSEPRFSPGPGDTESKHNPSDRA